MRHAVTIAIGNTLFPGHSLAPGPFVRQVLFTARSHTVFEATSILQVVGRFPNGLVFQGGFYMLHLQLLLYGDGGTIHLSYILAIVVHFQFLLPAAFFKLFKFLSFLVNLIIADLSI